MGSLVNSFGDVGQRVVISHAEGNFERSKFSELFQVNCREVVLDERSPGSATGDDILNRSGAEVIHTDNLACLHEFIAQVRAMKPAPPATRTFFR